MTKKNRLLFLSAVLIIGAVVFFRWETPSTQITAVKNSNNPISKAPSANQSEKTITRLPSAEIKNTNVHAPSNTVSHYWEKNLESSLRLQGGASLKDIKIEKLDSFVWPHDGIALHVETARITLTNDKNSQTTFKVMVDSQTGKILKNWDHPVFDPANPRDNFKLALDPRYHND